MEKYLRLVVLFSSLVLAIQIMNLISSIVQADNKPALYGAVDVNIKGVGGLSCFGAVPVEIER